MRAAAGYRGRPSPTISFRSMNLHRNRMNGNFAASRHDDLVGAVTRSQRCAPAALMHPLEAAGLVSNVMSHVLPGRRMIGTVWDVPPLRVLESRDPDQELRITLEGELDLSVCD